MPAKTSGKTALASKAAPKQAAPKKTASKGQRDDAHAHDHGHLDDDQEHVEFRLSKKTASVIDAALKGLTADQQERVLEAVDRVGEEAGETVGRWVEENVVANANELLALMAIDFAGRKRWDDLRALLVFLEHLDVPVDRPRLEKELKKAHGAKVAGEFKKQIGRTKEQGRRKK